MTCDTLDFHCGVQARAGLHLWTLYQHMYSSCRLYHKYTMSYIVYIDTLWCTLIGHTEVMSRGVQFVCAQKIDTLYHQCCVSKKLWLQLK